MFLIKMALKKTFVISVEISFKQERLLACCSAEIVIAIFLALTLTLSLTHSASRSYSHLFRKL